MYLLQYLSGFYFYEYEYEHDESIKLNDPRSESDSYFKGIY